MGTGFRPPTRWTKMSHVPRALLAYANDSPSGERLGLVSTPAASVSCVNDDHAGSGIADRRPSHHAIAVAARAAANAMPTIAARARDDRSLAARPGAPGT